MLTNAVLFERELKRLINEEIERLKDVLTVVPINVEGPNSVTFLQGSVSALRGLEDLIDEAKRRSDQNSR